MCVDLWLAYMVLCNMTRGIKSMQHNFTVQQREANNCFGQRGLTTGRITIMNVDEAETLCKQISGIIVKTFQYFKIKQIPGAIRHRCTDQHPRQHDIASYIQTKYISSDTCVMLQDPCGA